MNLKAGSITLKDFPAYPSVCRENSWPSSFFRRSLQSNGYALQAIALDFLSRDSFRGKGKASVS
jgi:hypothetical protein